MELKLFGKSVFEFKGKNSLEYLVSNSAERKSEFLPDFYNLNGSFIFFESSIEISPSGSIITDEQKLKNQKKKQKKEIHLTPKAVYELKMLNEEKFTINTDSKYVDEQVEQFKEKLDIVKLSENDMTNGIREVSSILIRMENRKKYKEFKDFYDNYAYTTTVKIDEVIKKHNYLKLGNVVQFVPDLPPEAIKEMKEYTNTTKRLCDKKPVFYIMADKKDFKKSDKRKDPILLAQSPFGHFWQIIGCWDKEMLFLADL